MSIFTWLRDALFEKADPAPEAFGPEAERTRGVGGTPIHNGWVQLPEQNARLLVPDARFKTFDQNKSNVAVIGTGVRYLLTLFSGIDWTIVPDEKLPGHDDESVKALIEEVEVDLATMNVPLKVVARRQALSHTDGLAIQAWRAGRKPDGKLGIVECSVRPPRTIERWDIDPTTGAVLGVFQRSPGDGSEHYIERQFMIYTVDDQLSDAPVGMGIMRHAVTDAHTMGVYERYEAIGYESDMKGIPVGRAPLGRLEALRKAGDLTEAEYRARVDALKKILDNHVKTGKLSILLDSATYEQPDGSPSNVYQYSLELLRGDQGTKYAAMDAAIDRRELRLARLFGIEHLFIGASSKGGYSQSKDRSKSYGQMVTSLAEVVAFDLRRDLIRPILILRGLDPDAPIKVLPDATNLLDAAEAADVAWKMAQAGMVFTPDDPSNNAIRRRAKLPPMPVLDDDTMLAIMQAQGMAPAPPPPVDPNKIDPATSKPYKDPNPRPAEKPGAGPARKSLSYSGIEGPGAEGACRIRQGALLPPCTIAITDENGKPWPMGQFEVAFFRMTDLDNSVRAAGRARIVPGGLQYEWREGDTNLPGEFRGIFTAVDSAGRSEVYPAEGFVRILIEPR